MAGSAMSPLRRHTFLRIILTAPLLLPAAIGWPASSVEAGPISGANQSATTQSSTTESPLPVFEMHSGFWVNLHHFLYLQARLLKGNSSSTESVRGAAQPDEHPASLIDFPEADIRAWQDAV